MPIQYKSGIVSEHNLTRNKSGIFDVSHMGQLFIKGGDELTTDLQKFFQLIYKNYLPIKASIPLMNEKGGIYDDLIITKLLDGYMIIF